MSADSLQDLYIEKLQDLYSAEQQIIEALPKMAAKATNPELRRGFETHLRQTEEHARRLEQLCQQHDVSPRGKKCEGIEGIIEEGQSEMKDIDDPDTRDALLIAAAQAVEHYEMAGYGTARTWARQCGFEDDARILQQTLDEEAQTDELLTQVAESMVNPRAMDGEREVSRSVQRDSSAAARGSSGSTGRSTTRPEDRPSSSR
jgi:ferritin-like metal-binding protein YciE